MGLLTDPSAGQGKVTKLLLKNYKKICGLLYIAGVIWFCLLAYPPMNLNTHFSENALLPGLVKNEFREDAAARIFHDELLDEMKKYEDSIPYPWLLAKMKQIGLDTFTHNFTLNYPLGKQQKFSGKNVYGILRAPRASSTEALILSVPYRPPLSVHPTTAPSIAIMLAFAKFAIREKYWAKDIIFLITEHEQLGMQAWLEAYHGVECGEAGTLDHGHLMGRAGAIQAAINLELHDTSIGQIDIKVEGLNGQLPNLDLFNLAAKICYKENVYYTFKNSAAKNFPNPIETWRHAFKTMLAMASTQATGVPNGNHGLYHRFGVEALTLEGNYLSSMRGIKRASFIGVGRIIEGIFRSLNNLLERFHQSYFFYLLPSSERFVSIGYYMPSISIIAGALLIKACAMWCKLQEEEIKKMTERESKTDKSISVKKKSKTVENSVEKERPKDFWQKMQKQYYLELSNNVQVKDSDTPNFVGVLTVFLLNHIIGILFMTSPKWLTSLGNQYGYTVDVSLYYGFIACSALSLLVPFFVGFRQEARSIAVFNIFSLLELGTALICVSMNNFSLALFIGVIYVPLALIISCNTNNRLHSALQKLLWFLAHPLIVLTATVMVYTYVMFPGESPKDNFYRGVAATQQAIAFGIVDSMIYGNWLFSAITSIFLPNWLCFWVVAFSTSPRPAVDRQKSKTD